MIVQTKDNTGNRTRGDTTVWSELSFGSDELNGTKAAKGDPGHKEYFGENGNSGITGSPGTKIMVSQLLSMMYQKQNGTKAVFDLISSSTSQDNKRDEDSNSLDDTDVNYYHYGECQC